MDVRSQPVGGRNWLRCFDRLQIGSFSSASAGYFEVDTKECVDDEAPEQLEPVRVARPPRCMG